MKNIDNEATMKQSALAAGLSLLLMAVLAPIANFGVVEALWIKGNAQETAANLAASEGAFRGAVAMFTAVAILDIIVAWGLYGLFEKVNRKLALLMGWFRALYAAAFIASLYPILTSLQWLDRLGTFPGADMQILSGLETFQAGWDLSLMLFAVHLLILGWLIIRSIDVPSWIGILVLLTGTGYVTDSLLVLVWPDSTFRLVTFTFAGELIMMVWLLIRGFRGFDTEKGVQK
ncbi:MAG: DUF4386 domain-containing protein [Dehalococcoidales bacterium]|nr:DUF4386 domain-containing protein [Dehalococcoidales bacterium]